MLLFAPSPFLHGTAQFGKGRPHPPAPTNLVPASYLLLIVDDAFFVPLPCGNFSLQACVQIWV